MDKDLIAKFLEHLAGLSISKMIAYAIIIFLGYFIYISSSSITEWADMKLNGSNKVEYFMPTQLNISPENLLSIKSITNSYIQKNPDIGMVLVYKFVPDHETFYQGRILATSVVNPSARFLPDKYNLRWLPISAFRTQSNVLLKGKVFTTNIHDIFSQYLQPDNEQRDEYLSPVNFHAIYNDGGKYMVSVPIRTQRVIGYISVYFTKIPTSDVENNSYIELTKMIASDVGYYISF